MTPEVRLSPDGSLIAVTTDAAGLWRIYEFVAVNSNAYVSHWTPLLPASSEDGAA